MALNEFNQNSNINKDKMIILITDGEPYPHRDNHEPCMKSRNYISQTVKLLKKKLDVSIITIGININERKKNEFFSCLGKVDQFYIDGTLKNMHPSSTSGSTSVPTSYDKSSTVYPSYDHSTVVPSSYHTSEDWFSSTGSLSSTEFLFPISGSIESTESTEFPISTIPTIVNRLSNSPTLDTGDIIHGNPLSNLIGYTICSALDGSLLTNSITPSPTVNNINGYTSMPTSS